MHAIHNTESVTLHVRFGEVYALQGPVCVSVVGMGWQVPAALHWPDVRLPQALSVRVREAGWLWSGAIYLDSPGDQFCKIRHRCG